MLKTKLVFDIFGKLSGLSINFLKSELTVTSSPPSLVQDLAAAIHCKCATFPIRYLGLPLSDRNLKKADYFPLIDRIQLSLTGWKAALLSIGGRVILTNAVLFAIPQYFMSIFLLPKWAVMKIDQIRRRFLWHGHRDQQGQKKGLYMVNWRLATKPRCLGGLDIRDLQIANQTLLMKWMWLWFIPTNDWWKEATVMATDSDRPWNDARASSFWKNMAKIAPAFHCSVAHQVAQGNTVLFWHDNWCGTPLKYTFPALYQAAINQFSSVRQNATSLGWDPQFRYLNSSAQIQKDMLLASIQDMHTAQGQDEVKWLRNPPLFSVSSAYQFLVNVPGPQSPLVNIWKIKAPLRVLVFAWLLLTDRLTTLENLSRRGWHLPSMCVMCRQSEETTHHLFCGCRVAKEIREYIFMVLSSQHSLPLEYKSQSSIYMLSDWTVNAIAKQWEIATCFILWRERCRRTFSEFCTVTYQLSERS